MRSTIKFRGGKKVCFGLVTALLLSLGGLYFGGRILAAAPVVGSIENETMSVPAGGSVVSDALASGGQALKITQNNAYAQGPVNLNGNAVNLVITARGDFCAGAWPRVSFYIDGTNVTTDYITSNSWTNYTIPISKATGDHTVRATMRNAKSDATCTRAAYLDVEVFYGEDSGPPPPPDYVAEALANSPFNPITGENVSFLSIIRNQSVGDSVVDSEASLRLDIGDDGTYDINFSNLPLSALPGGSSEAANWNDVWPAAEGTHRFEVCADATSAIAEADETNNCATAVFTVTPPPPPQPALDFSADPSAIYSGESSTLSWNATNVDSCTASGAWNGSKTLSGSESTGALTETQTYTLTCTGPYGSVVKDATVTVNLPPPPGGCTIADTSGCVPGHTLVFLDEQFDCNQPLTNYGALPLKVELNFSAVLLDDAVDLRTGCAGDGDPNSIDLILDVKGDGLTYGASDDAIKVRQQAGWNNGIQITGRADCGPRPNTNIHQDGVQAQGGRDITFVDFYIGNYDAGISTCQGAGGAMFYSSANVYYGENIHVIRGKYIACNKGLTIGSPGNTGSVTDAYFRSGRVDGTDPACVNLNGPTTCGGNSAVTVTNVTCQRWDSPSQTFLTLLWP